MTWKLSKILNFQYFWAAESIGGHHSSTDSRYILNIWIYEYLNILNIWIFEYFEFPIFLSRGVHWRTSFKHWWQILGQHWWILLNREKKRSLTRRKKGPKKGEKSEKKKFSLFKIILNFLFYCSQPGADSQSVGAQYLHLQPQNISGEIEMLQLVNIISPKVKES